MVHNSFVNTLFTFTGTWMIGTKNQRFRRPMYTYAVMLNRINSFQVVLSITLTNKIIYNWTCTNNHIRVKNIYFF